MRIPRRMPSCSGVGTRRGRSGPGVGNVTVKRNRRRIGRGRNEDLMKLECRRCVQRACRAM